MQGQENVRCDSHEKTLDEIKESLKDHEKRITTIEKENSASAEQIKTIFKYLGDIKDSINKLGTETAASITVLAAKVDGIGKRPGVWAERIILAIVITVLTAFITRNVNF